MKPVAFACLIPGLLIFTTAIGMPMTPTLPTPTPQAMPLPMPPQAAPMLPAPVPQAIPAMPAAIPSPQGQKALPTKAQPAIPVEFDQIATALAQLQSNRDAITQAMKELDDKMQGARNDTAQAKKISLSILSQASEAEAKAALDQVNALLQNLQTYQSDIQNQTSKTIDLNYTQMQTQFATIQEKLRNLQSRGIKLQVEQAQKIATTAKEQRLKLKQDIKTKSAEQETKGIVHSFFSGLADWLVSGGKAVYKTYRTVIEYLAGPTRADADQKKKDNNTATASQKLAGSPTNPDKVRALLNQCNQITKAIEFTYITLQERSIRLEDSISIWAKGNPIFAILSKIDTKDPSDKTSSPKISQLRKDLLGIVGWMLDGCGAVIKVVVWCVTTIYENLFAGIVHKVIGDVKKAAQQPANEKKQASPMPEQKPAASMPIPPAPPATPAPAPQMPAMPLA